MFCMFFVVFVCFCFLYVLYVLYMYVFENNFQLMSDSQIDDLEMSNIKFKKSISILFTLHTDLTYCVKLKYFF